MTSLRINPDLCAVAVSVLVQLPLAAFFGHSFDQVLSLQDGYLVSSGLNPYTPHVVLVFPNSYLMGVNAVVGYPPIWPLLMGLIYRLTYSVVPNLILYNLATKIPIIAGNIALAYITKVVLQRQQVSARKVRFAWLFLLFNPFILLTSTAWGQFDTLVGLLCVVSIYLLSRGMISKSMLLLSFSVVLKPIALPLLLLPLIAVSGRLRQKVLSVLIACFVVLAFWFLPFYLLGWSMPPLTQASVFVQMYGGLTVFSFVDLTNKLPLLTTTLGFLGYLWIPFLAVAAFSVYCRKPKTLPELVEAATLLLFVFFLSKTWLSEQSITVLLPFLLMLFCFGCLSLKQLRLCWVIPLVFLFFNFAVFLLLFLVYPPIVSVLLAFDAQFGVWRLLARFGVSVLWFVVGLIISWRLLVKRT